MNYANRQVDLDQSLAGGAEQHLSNASVRRTLIGGHSADADSVCARTAEGKMAEADGSGDRWTRRRQVRIAAALGAAGVLTAAVWLCFYTVAAHYSNSRSNPVQSLDAWERELLRR